MHNTSVGGTVDFVGATQVPLLEVLPTSGRTMWLGRRGNFQDARLTRQIDLSAVTTATLQYDVYHDIEAGFDFAYVSISRDGTTWEALPGAKMQRAGAVDDPGQGALESL